ncbi:MAG: CBS domain-containing protein [Desulfuromonadales bacterium]|jgi:predicted transcriptional regulator|nr:CBS domain-containing protein [Desulfuromonadales bacterium]
MLVGEYCNREVIITGRETSILEATQLMRRHHVGSLIVVDEQEGKSIPVGIITDRDIVVELLAAEIDLNSVSIGDAMSYELVTVTEQDDIMETVEKMRGWGVRRLPVIDSEGAIVGIFAADDMLELIAELLTGLVKLVSVEQLREQVRRR